MKASQKRFIKKYPIIGISLLLVVGVCNYINNKYLKPEQEIGLSKCIDGDTARFIIDGKEEKVRFLAINTPESTNKIEPLGKEASLYTCDLLSKAKNIKLEYEEDKRDKYDRLLAWIWLDDNLLQEDLVLKGYARVAYVYDDYKYTNRLLDAQELAMSKNIGVWNLK